MRVSNSLDPDQVRHLGLNCLQSLTAYNKSYSLLVRVNQNPGQRRSLINYLVSLINNVKNGKEERQTVRWFHYIIVSLQC